MDLGFNRDLVVAFLPLDEYSASEAQQRRTAEEVLSLVSRAEGVTAAALGTAVPFVRLISSGALQIDPRDPGVLAIRSTAVTPEFFRTLGIPLKDGRAFAEADGASSGAVVVVNETLAREIRQSHPPREQLLGIVGDTNFDSLVRDDPPMAYYPLAQRFEPRLFLVVRPKGRPADFIPRLQAILRGYDARLPVRSVVTMRELVSSVTWQAELLAAVSQLFSIATLLLIAVAVYAVIAYAALRRTAEFAIRAALGASTWHLAREIIRDTLIACAGGLPIGMLVAYWTSEALQRVVVGAATMDWLTLGGAALAVVLLAFCAAAVPSLKAGRGAGAVTLLRSR